MRIDLRTVEAFNFPDGQPHIAVKSTDFISTDRNVRGEIQVTARLASSDDLMRLLLLKDVLDRQRFEKVWLRIVYLLGARMDRPIDPDSPFTLRVITNLINQAGFHSVSIFDPHSDVSTALLNAKSISPRKYVSLALNRASTFQPPVAVMIPDAGAVKRTGAILEELGYEGPIVQALKHRDPKTGQLSGFQVVNPLECMANHVLIVDDLCDGGGTFVGLAAEARKHGAEMVSLYVSHGVFSKSIEPLLEHLDNVYTTDSYGKYEAGTYQAGHFIVDAL